jgi:hypothetical protein
MYCSLFPLPLPLLPVPPATATATAVRLLLSPHVTNCRSLLALEDPLTSPHADLMHVSHRAELSRDLNAAILTLQCKPSTSCIANILKCVSPRVLRVV